MPPAPDANPGPCPVDPVDNLARITAEIAAACVIAGREGAPGKRAGEVAIVAVSKKHPAAHILPILEAGHRVFGENQVQEAMAKWPSLREQFAAIELRLIGPLQSNKVAQAVGFFEVIETLDRPKIARMIADEIQSQARAPGLMIQVNTGGEPRKAGIAPGEADAFIALCRNDYGLVPEGLMCIPPANAVPGPHFALLRKIAERNGLAKLSMGMSGDYLDGVKLGATHVRIGTGIFGARPPQGEALG